MTTKIKLGATAFALLLIGGTAYAAVESWRPGMPSVRVDVRTADGGKMAPALMLIYSEVGRDPFFVGAPAPFARVRPRGGQRRQ